MSRFIAGICGVICALSMSPIAHAQDFPSKPIRIIYSSVAQEVIARLIAAGMTNSLGQQVVVEGRPSVVIAAQTVAQARPDGYTVLLSGDNFYLTPLTQKVGYDPVKDFNMIAIVGRAPLVLYVTPSLPVHSVEDLVALAKARPGELNCAIGDVGGGSNLALEELNTQAGINIVAVPFSSGAQQLTSLLGGQVQMTFAPPSPYMEQVKAGALRAVAVTSQTPSPLAPGLPPLSAAVPGFGDRIDMMIMAAPVGTPKQVVQRLNSEVVKALDSKEVTDRLLAAGLEVVGGTPVQADNILAEETSKLAAQIKAMGLAPK